MKIAIEGLTRTGKSTVCTVLQKELMNYFPVANLNDFLNNDDFLLGLKSITHPIQYEFESLEELLLYTVRLKRKSNLIKKLMIDADYSVILIDRYTPSITAFFEGVRQIDRDKIEKLMFNILEIEHSDLVFFIDADFERINERLSKGKISRKNVGIENFYTQYRAAYLSCEGGGYGEMFIIDGNTTIESIVGKMKAIVLSKIQSKLTS